MVDSSLMLKDLPSDKRAQINNTMVLWEKKAAFTKCRRHISIKYKIKLSAKRMKDIVIIVIYLSRKEYENMKYYSEHLATDLPPFGSFRALSKHSTILTIKRVIIIL